MFFFSEAGVELMQFFAREDDNLSDFQEFLLIKPQWDNRDYKNSLKNLKGVRHHLSFAGSCLISLSEFLTSHRGFF